MRETLYIRLQRADADTPLEYCIARADAVASFAVAQASLSELTALAAPRRVVVLLPGAEVRLASVQVPARQAAKVLQAAPFVLEEQLADDVDALHFALGTRQTDQRWPLAIIAHERLQAYLDLLGAYQIHPQQLIPDLLALPVPEAGQISVLIDGEQALLRSAVDAGLVCLAEDLPLCLGLLDPERQRRLRLMIPRSQNFDPSRLDWPMDVLHGYASPFEALLQQLRTAPSINLLQGGYSRREHVLRHLLPWRQAALAAGLALLLGGALYATQSLHLGRELEQQQEQNIARFQQVFPDEQRIVDLSSQLNQRLAGFQSSSGNFLQYTELLSQALLAVPGLKLQDLQFRDGALYASLAASRLEVLDPLKAWFAAGRSVAFSVDSADSGSEGVKLRVRLGNT